MLRSCGQRIVDASQVRKYSHRITTIPSGAIMTKFFAVLFLTTVVNASMAATCKVSNYSNSGAGIPVGDFSLQFVSSTSTASPVLRLHISLTGDDLGVCSADLNSGDLRTGATSMSGKFYGNDCNKLGSSISMNSFTVDKETFDVVLANDSEYAFFNCTK